MKWVTRERPKIDRIACPWLIRRFIDPEARFRFVPAKGYQPGKGELRFDMFEAEFTHEGDLCTFEVLVRRFGLVDPALGAVAEIVHDVDVKDGKYGREEAGGVGQLVAGIAAAHPEDEARLARGAALFDDLYAACGAAGAFSGVSAGGLRTAARRCSMLTACSAIRTLQLLRSEHVTQAATQSLLCLPLPETGLSRRHVRRQRVLPARQNLALYLIHLATQLIEQQPHPLELGLVHQ